jgi:hypothetical protein
MEGMELVSSPMHKGRQVDERIQVCLACTIKRMSMPRLKPLRNRLE